MRRTALALVGALVALSGSAPADAGCGCNKPPPPRAVVRPFVGHADQRITLFDDRFVVGQRYDVLFESTVDGSVDWSRGKAVLRRDLADGVMRPQLRVPVGTVALGPCRISVWDGQTALLNIDDDEFTVIAAPIALHDFSESVGRGGYQAAVGRDGTAYVAFDVSQVTEATTFTGQAFGLPLQFLPGDVTMYNEQGFLMQLLDPTVPGLFQISVGADDVASTSMSYWRHEFRTYKRDHRRVDGRRLDDDPDWHADGTYHVDHDHIVVAIHGSLRNGQHLEPGATPAFWLQVTSSEVPVPAASIQ
jgi:hypothetical protein